MFAAQTCPSLNVSDYVTTPGNGFAWRDGTRLSENVRTQFADTSSGGLKASKVWYKTVTLTPNTTQTFNLRTGVVDDSGANVAMTSVRAVYYRVVAPTLAGTVTAMVVQFPETATNTTVRDKIHGLLVSPTTTNLTDGTGTDSIIVTCPNTATGTGTLYLLVVGD